MRERKREREGVSCEERRGNERARGRQLGCFGGRNISILNKSGSILSGNPDLSSPNLLIRTYKCKFLQMDVNFTSPNLPTLKDIFISNHFLEFFYC